MGKDSLIKSTTKKKPAAKKEDNTKQAQKISAKAKKTANPKSDVAPKKKVDKAKESAKKGSVVKAKTTTIDIKEAAPKATAQAPANQPSKAKMETKPLLMDETFSSDSPASTDPMTSETETKPADPAQKLLHYGVAGFVLLLLMVVIASWMNAHRYYVKSSEGAVGIWQGKFAPKGAKHLISFPGLQLAEPIKDSYTANEVFPIVCQYYLDKADMLLDVPGMPDFDGIKEYLNKSQAYATTREMKTVISNRLVAINFMVLLYKADVAASKNSLEDLETAMGYLKEALTYRVDELESALVKQKAEAVRKKIEGLKAMAVQAAEGKEDKK